MTNVPRVPGVPGLASYAANAIVLLFQDVIGFVFGGQQVVWGIFLDGEIWIGRGQHQRLMSIVKDLVPGPGWPSVTYKVFDFPPTDVIFANGHIDETNYKKSFTGILHCGLKFPLNRILRFDAAVQQMIGFGGWNAIVGPLPQHRLVMSTGSAMVEMGKLLKGIEDNGGEGIVLRHPKSWWVPQRSHQLLKMKTLHDAEAIVVGYTSGRETDLGSKLLGLMGALIVRYKGKEFELSGFTDKERRLEINGDYIKARDYCSERPGTRVDAAGISNPSFPIGSKVTFQYRELTDDGRPKEARYWRKFQ